MSNIAGKAYAMNVVTPMKPGKTRINRFIFMALRCFPSTLKPLKGLQFIHFARWVIIKRDQWPDPANNYQDESNDWRRKLCNDYMLFCSNFNGTWHQYIDAFSDGVPTGLDLAWYSSTRFPQSIPLTPFKRYIGHNQIDTDYYYNATPGSSQRDIKAALKLQKALRVLTEKHASGDVDAFEKAFNTEFLRIQNCLAAPGYAPVASNDTEKADANRAAFIEQQLDAVETVTDRDTRSPADDGLGKRGAPSALSVRLRLEREARNAKL